MSSGKVKYDIQKDFFTPCCNSTHDYESIYEDPKGCYYTESTPKAACKYEEYYQKIKIQLEELTLIVQISTRALLISQIVTRTNLSSFLEPYDKNVSLFKTS